MSGGCGWVWQVGVAGGLAGGGGLRARHSLRGAQHVTVGGVHGMWCVRRVFTGPAGYGDPMKQPAWWGLPWKTRPNQWFKKCASARGRLDQLVQRWGTALQMRRTAAMPAATPGTFAAAVATPAVAPSGGVSDSVQDAVWAAVAAEGGQGTKEQCVQFLRRLMAVPGGTGLRCVRGLRCTHVPWGACMVRVVKLVNAAHWRTLTNQRCTRLLWWGCCPQART